MQIKKGTTKKNRLQFILTVSRGGEGSMWVYMGTSKGCSIVPCLPFSSSY